MFNIFRNQETQQNTAPAHDQQSFDNQQSVKEKTKMFVDKINSDFKEVNVNLNKIRLDLNSSIQKMNDHISQHSKLNAVNNIEYEKFKKQTTDYLENLSKNATDTLSDITIQIDLIKETHENDFSMLWERLEKIENRFNDFANYDMNGKYVYSNNGSKFKREKVLIHGHYWFADCFREISRGSPYFENILSAWRNILDNSNATTYYREKYEWSKENGILAIALHSKSYSNCTIIGIPNFGAPQNKVPVDIKIYEDFENAPILSRVNCENPLEKSGESWFFAKKNEIRNKLLIG